MDLRPEILIADHLRYQEFLSSWETRYKKICEEKTVPNWEDEQAVFFTELNEFFDVPNSLNIWYAPQRSWYRPEMMNIIVNMSRNPDKYDFLPNFGTGDFTWNVEELRFEP